MHSALRPLRRTVSFRSFRVTGRSGPSDADRSSVKKSEAQVRKELDALLSQAQQAAFTAEESIQKLDTFDSAKEDPPHPKDLYTEAVRQEVLRLMATLGVVFITLYTSHLLPLPYHGLISILCGVALGLRGFRKRSLDLSGALAAAVVGAVTQFCSFRCTAVLLTFYFTSSALTQYKEEAKEGIDDSFKKGGQRTWVQVFANAGVPTLLAAFIGFSQNLKDLPLGAASGMEPIVVAALGAFLGYFSCCCGDTWASELGTLSQGQPRLITTFKPVRRGTNGAISLLGTAASVAGGLTMGLIFALAGGLSPAAGVKGTFQWVLVPMGLALGVFGSLLDSVLGATVQFSGLNTKTQRITGKPGPDVIRVSGHNFLDNNAVNFVSAMSTALVGAALSLTLFGTPTVGA